MDVQCLSNSPSPRMDLLRHPHWTTKFVILGDLAISVAYLHCLPCDRTSSLDASFWRNGGQQHLHLRAWRPTGDRL